MQHTFFKLAFASFVLGFSVNALAVSDQDTGNPVSYEDRAQMDQLNPARGESKEKSTMPALPDSKEGAQPLQQQIQQSVEEEMD